MVLIGGPNELRAIYIGHSDLISRMIPIHLKTWISQCVTEILAIAIRCNSKIKGIIHNERKQKINQFADDTVFSVVSEDKSLSTALTCIDHLKYISGFSMNKNKSSIIRIGSITYSDLTLLSGKDLNWSGGKFQSFSINLSVETGEIPNLSYPERTSKGCQHLAEY